jgi:DNA polymerase IV (archaeal DinB-like DNA polymerase)
MVIIMHIDMDCFFAAVEEKHNPEIKGKPVVIGADPKNGAGRGVAATCNYKAREFGIHSAMSITQAYKRCPTAVFLQPNFKRYSSTSQRLMKIFKSFAEKTQQVSIDELYLDISNKVQNYQEAKNYANRIKKVVKKKEQLNCSIGIGPNKLIAKIASDMNKPDGITVVPPEEVHNFLSPLPVRKLIGIGPKTEQKLATLNIRTIEQLRRCSKQTLLNRFGVWGGYMHNMALGKGSTAVSNYLKRKSIGKQRTFDEDTKNSEDIVQLLYTLAEMVHAKLTERKFYFKTVTIVVRFADFDTRTSASSTHIATNNINVIKESINKLIHPYLHDQRKMRLVGVRLSNFTQKQPEQMLLC